MSAPELPEVPPAPLFRHRLHVVTLSVLLVVLLFHMARELQAILQPLFIAYFLAYLILPAHALLVRGGLSPRIAFALFLTVLLVGLFYFGQLIYSNVEEAVVRLPHYERRLQQILDSIAARLPWQREEVDAFFTELPISSDQLVAAVRATLGRFLDFFTWLAVTLVYLIFVIAETVTFPKRVLHAFGETRGNKLLAIIISINHAIAQYIVVKTFMSVIAGVLSAVVLALFGVDFYLMWGILIFLLNYIPYLGSLVAVVLPILLSFVQLEEAWKSVVIAVLLVAIQQVIGTIVEPRMAGQRLGVSPILILLSLAFWGLVWGVVGMILAVPLLMMLKIILENIPETKPLATLMSNVE